MTDFATVDCDHADTTYAGPYFYLRNTETGDILTDSHGKREVFLASSARIKKQWHWARGEHYDIVPVASIPAIKREEDVADTSNLCQCMEFWRVAGYILAFLAAAGIVVGIVYGMAGK